MQVQQTRMWQLLASHWHPSQAGKTCLYQGAFAPCAGTRYRRRGVNDSGHVANHVETEQIVSVGQDWRTGFPVVSSVVQVQACARVRAAC